jgi:hypothetical protein
MREGVELQRRSRQGFTRLEIPQRQAMDSRLHTPIVLEARKAEIDRDCGRIVQLLRGATHAS